MARARKIKREQVDERFWQLLALADEGDECAQADLWHEFEFNHGVDEAPEPEVGGE
jgi:hypothetical protein